MNGAIRDSNGVGGAQVDQHAIQVDFMSKSKSASIFHKYGAASDVYENTMFENDLVMIFPLREGGEIKKPEAFTKQAFVDLLLSRDPFQRVLRTTRCFLDELGNDPVEAMNHGVGTSNSHEVKHQLLEAEYEKFVGSAESTTEHRFCKLVATAISLKSENDDLRVEADRTNYRLQVSNKPFDDMLHRDKIAELKREVGDSAWKSSLDHLRTKRGTTSLTSDTPEMDPLLISRGDEFHPRIRKALCRWGHREEADGMFSGDDNLSQTRWSRFWTSIFSIQQDPMTYFAPFADYRHEPEFQPYFRRYPMNWGGQKEQTLFTQKDRIRLASGIVDRHVNLDALQEAGYLKSHMFALHDEAALKELRATWALNVKMLFQPIHKIRYYFGEKIALYFAWLEFYTKMLIFPAIAGIITIIYEDHHDGGNDNDRGYFLVAFAIFVVIWSSMFSEFWKRKCGLLGSIWGCHGLNAVFRYRPQFRGTKSYNPVTDKKEMTYESRTKRHRWFVVSVTVVTIMVGIVIVALVGLFVLKHYINNADNLQNIDVKYRTPLTLAVTVANAVQILILNMVYRLIARKLNDLENHRTDAEYENYLAIKVFLFQFCNSFASFFYIAFIKRTVEDGCLYEDDCMKELRDQLLVLFLVRIVVGNTTEVAIPYLKYRFQLFAEDRSSGDKTKVGHNLIEAQAKLAPYESSEAFEDYNELAIQFGFHNLFVVAFPLTPLLALINNIVEVHVDASKLCFSCRRPFPHPAKSIGVWFYIFRFMTYITVATNAALILWTSDLFENYSGTVKALSFIIVWQVGLAISLFIERTVPDMPKYLDLLLERYDHIVNIVFKNLSDGDASHLNEVSENLDLTIYPNDQWEDTGVDVKAPIEMRDQINEVRAAGYPHHELGPVKEYIGNIEGNEPAA
ncbi:Anoctamin protein [Phytophthora megakarya]|uniref:Anoctamin protein n=1 Tax=Phytophthora megakarya TaxID=4795 RepID=A0A225WXZ5_9STRA|nr:Anoctamin protein [Phytophthora megakarya]